MKRKQQQRKLTILQLYTVTCNASSLRGDREKGDQVSSKSESPASNQIIVTIWHTSWLYALWLWTQVSAKAEMMQTLQQVMIEQKQRSKNKFVGRAEQWVSTYPSTLSTPYPTFQSRDTYLSNDVIRHLGSERGYQRRSHSDMETTLANTSPTKSVFSQLRMTQLQDVGRRIIGTFLFSSMKSRCIGVLRLWLSSSFERGVIHDSCSFYPD